jgi:drug/metabolite transporter (DMT)-like permease
MVVWLSVLARLDVGLVSLSVYLLPFFGVVLSALLVGDRLTAADLVGGVISLAGTLLVTLVPDRPATAGVT